MHQSSATYEATVLTGLEFIAKDEIKSKFNVDATVAQGRVWFVSSKPVDELLRLKSICNLYVVMFDQTLTDQQMPQDAASLESLLFQVGDGCDWQVGVSKWRQTNNFSDYDLDKLFTKDADLRQEQPKFRVSCNRYGPKHKFTSPEVCCTFGHVMDTRFGWPIKMKGYDLEVLVTFSENRIYAGITLTPKSLDMRNIISTGMTTLRAATCYALLRLADLQCGDIVFDPMAGSGAIPVECNACWKEEWLVYSLAGELKSNPLEKCKINMKSVSSVAPGDVLQSDVTSLPIRSSSIDVFVSDLPFGRRHGSKKLNRTLYPALLRELARVAQVGTSRAVLLTQDFKSMNLASDRCRSYWVQKLCTFVKIGNLDCHIYLFHRNEVAFDESPIDEKISRRESAEQCPM